ncbi:hypothetical protein SUGI_0118610 [Cryptomeria japonica]|uniref:uncharacterized protein LOC131073246 n=1 Tax=Cryptomeria japonica TaxID=3369 RepID=UPI002408B0AB|nr:uncharacterized protein LOC131073246 [Cryptomeria japonica]GLJ09935.1 hypothetical protein SUGI_0118610 [Cryptomeria japonica]
MSNVIRNSTVNPNPIVAQKMLAAVDMGTNSFHMIVVKVHPNGRFCKVDSYKEYVRLGSGTLSSSGIIGAEEEHRALEAMKRFRTLAESHKSDMRIVATSAVREAKNRVKFVRRVSEVAGADVEVLSGKEEARLIYLGILQSLPVFNKAVLTVDIGGGSTEFVLGLCGEVIHATSLKLGHIRLTESFLRNKDGKLQESHIEQLRRHIRSTFADSNLVEKVREIGFEMAIGTSGTIESIQKVIHQGHAVELGDGYEGDGYESMPVFYQAFRGCEFTSVELSVIVTKLCQSKNKEECLKLFGFAENRLDSIVAGAILLQEIFEIFGIDRMTVSSYALREGVIADTLEKSFNEYVCAPNIRWSSVTSLARRFNNKKKMKSDMHSVQLAKELLEGLQRCKKDGQDCFSLAGLSINENDIELMESAILLHGIGMHINHKGYHKHSYYLIKNNAHLHGYSTVEIEIIALLARYHRKKFPSHKHDSFAKLPHEAQKKVKALSAIIRIAVALERSNFSAVQQVDVMYDNGAYTIVVTPSLMDPLTGVQRDVSLEVWAAQSEFKYFEEVFGRKILIAVAGNLKP